MSVLEAYKDLLKNGTIAPDPHQENAITALQNIEIAAEEEQKKRGFFRKKQTSDIRGVYMYGGVGRGKSMVMDLFFNESNIDKKRRIHFHEFMIETHDFFHKAKEDDSALMSYAKEIAKNTKLLCFDEFHVTNVADAMILSRLFTALLESGIFVIATSNWAPDDLYKDGLQRVRFLPFIDLLKEKLNVVHLSGATDYRQEVLIANPTYFYPFGPEVEKTVDALFQKLAGGETLNAQVLTVKGRKLKFHATQNGIARASFAELCEKPLGAEDYITFAQAFHTVFLEHIPKMGYDRRNEIKRFITLIDALYEAKTKVIFMAEAAPDKIYSGSDHAFEFERTLSRINEMQSTEYLENAQ